MDSSPLPNGGHDPRTYHTPLVNPLHPLPQAYHSQPNGYPPYYTSDPRTTALDGGHPPPLVAPTTREEHHFQHPTAEERANAENRREGIHLPNPLAPNYPLYSQEPNQPPQPPHLLTVPSPPSPSYKALGKRRASSIEPPHIIVDYHHEAGEAPPYPGLAADRTRQKSKSKPKAVARPTKAPVTRTRVMPSRQRRGTTAYGIGSNPIDAMVIEAQQRAAEQVPIVEPDAVFVITTDPKGLPVAGPSSGGVGTRKEGDKYFEREEVAESVRQQAIIQTPEYCLLSEVYQPSSRLRTRTEVEGFDSSDAAYERLHRKPEMFEKRQRRREKDKLEHERYKLKERVEQLRTMDLHHFRALLPPNHPTSGSDPTSELETVRNELLAHADDLIRRYDVLLPPDPRAANGQRLRLKEWEIRREGNRFIPLTDEAASELAAAGLLDEQSAAEAAAAGILITATGPGLPPLGGKGAKGYGSGFRPNLVPSDDEDEGEVEGELNAAEEEVEVEMTSEEPPHEEEVVDEPQEQQEASIPEPVVPPNPVVPVVPVTDAPPRPSSGAFKIKLKFKPTGTPRSSDLSQDATRPPSEQGSANTQEDNVPSANEAPIVDPLPLINDVVDVNPPVSPVLPRQASPPPPFPHDEPIQTSPVPLAVPPPPPLPPLPLLPPLPPPFPSDGPIAAITDGVWTELPYHDVPYEHQSRDIQRDILPAPAQVPAPAAPVVAPRVRTPRVSTPVPVAIPVLIAAGEREASQVAGRRGRKLRTADAFGVKIPRALEEEREFRLPEEWIEQRIMLVDEGSEATHEEKVEPF
ncbi:hypothetical protein BDV93DRAFT_257619 [Ceratobasidium sp. AG-I]|nr:hypothetical protein BDV93DRAFT_257619 [Ceratobasidium sp. AG-I]